MTNVNEIFASKVFDDKVMRARLPEKIYNSLRQTIDQGQALGTIITKKPIEASEQEKEENSRSKSAKVRIFEKN